MKKTNLSRAVALAIALPMAAAACDMAGLTDINVNPNAPTNPDPSYLLPYVQESAVRNLLGTGLDRVVASQWVQHYASLQYGNTDRYEGIEASSYGDAYWDAIYAGALVDAQLVIERSPENEKMQGAGRVMKAWMYSHLTDLWGAIPYSQALTGHTGEINIIPSYDSQESIYTDLLKELGEAQAQFASGSGEIGNTDIIYEGDAVKWRKFANSLRLRYAMRISEVAPAQAAAAAAAAVNDGVFTSAADEAKLRWQSSAPNQNPLYVADFERPGDYRVSKTIVDTLGVLNDPRLPIYAQPLRQTVFSAADDTVSHYWDLPDGATVATSVHRDPGDPVPWEGHKLYRGLYNGYPNGVLTAFEQFSRFGDWFLDPTAPSMIQSYAEVLFLQAEAAEKGFTDGDPAALYAAGITASMQRYGISAADIETYLAQPRVLYAGGEAGLQQIWLQKWIELYDVGPEAYAEWRRTDIPVLTASIDNRTNDVIPRRFPYPLSEQNLNGESYAAAVKTFGDPKYDQRLWWDVK